MTDMAKCPYCQKVFGDHRDHHGVVTYTAEEVLEKHLKVKHGVKERKNT